MKADPAPRVTELQIEGTCVSFGVFGPASSAWGRWHWADPFRPGAWHGPFPSLTEALQNAEAASRSWSHRGH